MKIKLFIILSLLSTFDLAGQTLPFQNPGLSSEERAKDLISRLTLEEKAALMCDQSDAIPRLGIKKFNWWSEALHGLANNKNVTVLELTSDAFEFYDRASGKMTVTAGEYELWYGNSSDAEDLKVAKITMK